jgi:hypothetical protein
MPRADHLAAPDINVGDPEAACRRGGSTRPVRPLAPEMQAPPVDEPRKLAKGAIFWIVGHEECPTPKKAKIIRLSNEPGKQVGVEFDEPIGGVDSEGNQWGLVHTCDNRGKPGHCLYVRGDQCLDDRAMEAWKTRKSEVQAEASKWQDFDEITIGPDSSMPVTPAIELKTGPNGTGGKAKDEDEDEEDDDK